MNPDISEPHETSSATNAVSLFGQSGGVNDFPVLKAFQEYIDAEQAKARKRMLGLSVFFILLLIVVVITFTLVITSVIGRNQQLSDRLLDIALREKTATQPVVNVQSPAPAVVQPSVESAELVRLREELRREKEERKSEQAKRDEDRFNKLLDAISKPQQQPVAAPAPVVVTTSPSPVLQPAAAESAELLRLREELRREKEERQAEQAKAKEEKRKAEIEAHRRRLYPEYYAQEDARRAAAEAAAAEPIRPVEPPRRVAPPLPRPNPVPVAAPPLPKAKTVPAAAQPPQASAQPQKLRTMKPVSYFDSSAPDEDPELEELLKKHPAPQAKPPSKPAVNPKPQQPATTKPAAARPAPQPSTKPAPKPTAQPAATPAARRPAQPEKKTETLAIGGAADGSSIPWLIELPNK